MFDTSEPPLFSWPSPYGGHLVFARVCPDCNMFVKPHENLNYSESFDGIYTFEPNAECKQHGPVIKARALRRGIGHIALARQAALDAMREELAKKDTAFLMALALTERGARLDKEGIMVEKIAEGLRGRSLCLSEKKFLDRADAQSNSPEKTRNE